LCGRYRSIAIQTESKTPAARTAKNNPYRILFITQVFSLKFGNGFSNNTRDNHESTRTKHEAS
jgi:hypothetical protein